ncbi:MAG: hypothetical protein JNL28_17680 [Planctomycetes bacterium]|nr:hypothetical protein [Planctomycetota bacterium]
MDEQASGAVMDLTQADWERLAEMRAGFLRAPDMEGAVVDYWHSRRDLLIYDATFGARIEWKWRAVLAEIARRGIDVPTGSVLDWGAGTGVATRAFLRAFGAADRRVHLFDRSQAALEFAANAIAREIPGAKLGTDPCNAPDVLLVSHVLDELDSDGVAALLATARRARLVIWVESGAKACARKLSTLREHMLDELTPLLPCTHRAACGVLAEDRAGDWCHHFAPPAAEAFTTKHWRTFSHTLSIDLRSLPYAYLVARRTSECTAPTNAAVRLIGTARVEKGRARLLVCDASGVRESRLLERTDKAYFKALGKGTAERLLALEEAEGRITRIVPL